MVPKLRSHCLFSVRVAKDRYQYFSVFNITMMGLINDDAYDDDKEYAYYDDQHEDRDCQNYNRHFDDFEGYDEVDVAHNGHNDYHLGV